MRHKFTCITLLLLTSFIFYGGAGVKIVTYCCHDCCKAGIKAVVEKSYCETHHHFVTVNKNTAETQLNDSHVCSLERISFEWNIQHDDELFSFEPLCFDVSFDLFDILLISEHFSNLMTNGKENDPPPVRLPRKYLSLLTALLI
ncbi:MAG: hypothetical protein PHG27_03340 [Massilibacteroides sp.]|nr:hypothetical protein [Massilibacteroides sp.]MDD3061273.1 hypothetical protein [Massilibacteroides sp.]MDD4114621.1 hypothetical protein [Massilibacteroides sp.]MDD4659770.1 hypothetical protein [Massilibacteroides sp.]